MRIRLRTTLAGPALTAGAGDIVTVAPALGAALIEAGYATPEGDVRPAGEMQHCPFGRETERLGNLLPSEDPAASAFDRRRRLQDQVFEEVVVGAAGDAEFALHNGDGGKPR